MRNLIFVLIMLYGLCGCGRPTTTFSTPPVIYIDATPEAPLPNIPPVWFKVESDDWLFALPSDFDRLTLGLPSDVLKKYYSTGQELTIEFYAHTADRELRDFVINEFLLNGKAMMLQSMEKVINNRQVMAIYSLLLPDLKNASLDFFAQKDRVIYQLSCYGNAVKFKETSDMCFKIADTLYIK